MILVAVFVAVLGTSTYFIIRLLVVIDNKIGACAENGYKHRNKNHTDFLFH